MLYFIFLYLGLPSIFSMYAIMENKMHDACLLMWLIVTVGVLTQYGYFGVIIGSTVIGVHFWMMIRNRLDDNDYWENHEEKH